jgi:CDP-glycerol glycerophosphotransferase
MRILARAPRRLRQVARAVVAELQAVGRRGRVRPGTVLYESFAGNGALCNPEAVFRELLRSPDFADLRHTWVLDDPRAHRSVVAEFAGDARVSFVRYRSLAYYRALATSEYLVNNATFPAEFSKRPGQVYLNTWHGTPLKRMGYDMAAGATESANTLRNFLAADFLLSQNPFMTEQMYEQAYLLRGAFRGLIIEEGYPRVDRQLLDHDETLAGRARLEAAGIDIGSRDIVLYAPTWRGGSFYSPDDDARTLVDATLELQRLLGTDRYVVLLKTHQVVHRFAAANPEYRALLVPNDIPTNSILGVTSVLVTDYSSIFFDFLASSRPIVFYTPDVAAYSENRGTYFAPDDLPGPVCATLPDVAGAIAQSGSADDEAARAESWRERFTPWDDGSVSRRIVDVVFRGRADGSRVRSISDDGRASLLLHLGGMRSNGITTSALNLLNAIDHDRFDVSVVFGRPRSQDQLSNQARINPRVRQFHRVGGMNGSKLTHGRRRISERLARVTSHRESSSQRLMWDAEWLRCFGDSRFDVVVDFSGYTAFWATLMLHSPGGVRSVWLHNDMAAEVHRVIRGKRRMRHTLPAVFALYGEFDSLVSVSESLNSVNRAALAGPYGLTESAFRSARNLVDGSHALDGLAVPLDALESEVDAAGGDSGEDPLAFAWARRLADKQGTRWFVTVGRFSTEKNQARLLRAFASVHDSDPNARLVIVGYGPLRDELRALLRQLGLESVAFVVGPFSNPFPILAAADCFVLSSDYEGQPMVILEAAIAELPIVSVDFGSVRDALPGSTIHVVAQTDDALADGMRAFLRGEVEPSHLDVESYNRSAVAEFYAATMDFAVAPVRSGHRLW